MKISLALLVLVETASLSFVKGQEAGCPCLFNGEDPDDCVVWGTLDGELKAWSSTDQACLDAYQIKIDAPDPSLLCSSANSFVNGLKNGALSLSTVKFGLGIPYGGFWEESTMNPDIPVLKDSITIDGTTYDCEASESDCYNAMKPYFETDAEGIQEKDDVCQQIQNMLRTARETEQSVLRVRICQEDREGTAIVSECSAMFSEMESELAAFSSMNCGGFGTGIGSQTLPDCDGNLTNDGDGSLRLTMPMVLSFCSVAMAALLFVK